MLFRQADLAAIAAGEITVAFRRWKRPMARAGGTQQTPAGVLAFDAVERVDDVTDADARRAGLRRRRRGAGAAARARRRPVPDPLPRRRAGPADRAARRRRPLDRSERAAIAARLARLDRASRHGPWTEATLRAIADAPGRARGRSRRSGSAASALKFKTDVRKLKALGLTESLEVGYRLSPRGRAYLGD